MREALSKEALSKEALSKEASIHWNWNRTLTVLGSYGYSSTSRIFFLNILMMHFDVGLGHVPKFVAPPPPTHERGMVIF